MRLKELLKDLSWVKSDKNNKNCVSDFINSFNLKHTEFESIQKKIACANIFLLAKERGYDNAEIVLKQNYTEEEFVEFLKELNINTLIDYVSGTVWSKDEEYIWEYEYNEHQWIKQQWIIIPSVPDVCKR